MNLLLAILSLQISSKPTDAWYATPLGKWTDVDDPAVRAAARTDWMRNLPDGRSLALVSIPGTHDSATWKGISNYDRAQSLTLSAQLALGVRALDIRLRQVGKALLVYHGPVDERVGFDEVRDACAAFLKAHPSETILMRVKRETAAKAPIGSFMDAFEGYGGPFYRASSRTTIPKIGDVRGRIVVLDDVGLLPDAIGYANPTMSVQDLWDTSDMGAKTKAILSHLAKAREAKEEGVWFLNYTSSSTFAVGQLANAQAVNAQVDAALGKGHLGTIFMNFPGAALVGKVVESNI